MIFRIVKNVISNFLKFVISALIPIFMTPFLIHRLGESHYGIWIIAGSVIGYYGLLDLGVASSVIRYVSKYSATGDKDNLNHFVNTVLFLFISLGIFSLIISFVLYLFAANIFNMSEKDTELFSKLILLFGINFAISFPARIFNNILQAIQRYDIANIIDISCFIAQTCMIIYFISRGGGLIALGMITLLMSLINGLFSFFMALRMEPMLKIDLRYAQKSKLRTVFGYSVFAFIWGVAEQFRFQTNYLVIGAFLSTSAVTYYSISARLLAYYQDMVSVFTTITKPMFSSVESQNRFDKIRDLFLKGTRYCSLLAIFIGISLILYGKPFIKIWLGDGYESSYYAMLILIAPYIINLSQGISITAVYGIEKHKFLSIVTLGEGLINLGIGLLLVKRYGIYGIAIGTAIPMLIAKLSIQPMYVCRVVGIKISEYITKGLLPQFLIGIIYFVIMRILIYVYYPISYFSLLLSALISFIIFAVLSVFIILNSKERNIILNWISVRIAKI